MERVKPIDVANFFLSAIDKEEAGDLISHLKIQKLVYYAQGVHLAMFNKELFDEEIEAWGHGPVVPSLYHEFKSFGSGAIEPNFENFSLSIFTKEQRDMLKEVYITFGQFSAWMLRNMTHEERPWVKTTKNGKIVNKNLIIDKTLLQEYFKTQIED